MSFQPASATVKVGQKVIWKNQDTATHTATADGGQIGTGFIDPGGQASITIEFVGEVAYHCSVHPTMTATLTGTN
jgi:plastocyanin